MPKEPKNNKGSIHFREVGVGESDFEDDPKKGLKLSIDPDKEYAKYQQKVSKQEKSMTQDVKNNKPKTKKFSYLKAFLIFFTILILIAGAWIFATLSGVASKIFTKNKTGGSPLLSFVGNLDPAQLKGEGDGRINILLLGMAGGNYPGATLTDTIMVASIDPKNNTMAMLSVPRDLYVSIPGDGKGKINSVYQAGEDRKNASSKTSLFGTTTSATDGPTLTKQVIGNILDLPIDYYIQLDFDGFREAIDELGGVKINVSQDLVDPYYPTVKYGYQTLKINSGTQYMDGELALKYARSRETTTDFDRARRQQEIISAVRQKMVDLNIITSPKTINSLLQIMGNHLRTDLTPKEAERLAYILKGINSNTVVTKVLDDSATGGLVASQTADGQFILLPVDPSYQGIQDIVHQLFTDPYIQSEKAAIEVQNGSQTAGLANNVSTQLKQYGYNIVAVDNSPNTVANTIIYDYTNNGKPYTIAYLKKRFNATVVTGDSAHAKSGVDLVVVVGSNYSNQ